MNKLIFTLFLLILNFFSFSQRDKIYFSLRNALKSPNLVYHLDLSAKKLNEIPEELELFNSTTKVTVAIYLYNRHDTNSLSSNDIVSPLINGVRRGIATLTGPAILNSVVTSAKRDGGSIHPFTVAELTAEIEFVEALNCAT